MKIENKDSVEDFYNIRDAKFLLCLINNLSSYIYDGAERVETLSFLKASFPHALRFLFELCFRFLCDND